MNIFETNFVKVAMFLKFKEGRFLEIRVITSRILRWAGHVARMEEDRSVSKILTGKLIGKRPLMRPRRRWEDNVRMDLA